jgi:putative transcriptional regulator
MTQEELAGKIGVVRQTIIAIENGRYVPSLELGFRIARVFGTGIEDVFRYEAGKKKK